MESINQLLLIFYNILFGFFIYIFSYILTYPFKYKTNVICILGIIIGLIYALFLQKINTSFLIIYADFIFIGFFSSKSCFKKLLSKTCKIFYTNLFFLFKIIKTILLIILIPPILIYLRTFYYKSFYKIRLKKTKNRKKKLKYKELF